MPKGKVLVVDDEEDVREVLKFYLGEKNIEIIEAENGEKAIQILNNEDIRTHVKVILCDIRMPKVNGIECIKYLQKAVPEISIVVVTAYPDTEMAIKLLKSGVKDYLVKPVGKERLISVVRKQMNAKK
jgi:DNA-binding NtrC family response regulator